MAAERARGKIVEGTRGNFIASWYDTCVGTKAPYIEPDLKPEKTCQPTPS
jgi:hypothetical protein